MTRNQFSILIGGACSVLVGCWSWVSVNQSELNLWNVMSIIIHRLSDELYCDLLQSKKSCQECIFCEFVRSQNTFLLTQILYTLLFKTVDMIDGLTSRIYRIQCSSLRLNNCIKSELTHLHKNGNLSSNSHRKAN